MVIAGVIAEYNPFHTGHSYHLSETRRLGATHIVAVMSGAAVQRGDVAVWDKYHRARCALRNGADLVIELPCPYSCGSAERFARAGVELLAGLGEGVVELLSFGSESSDIGELTEAARISEKLSDSDRVRELVSEGLSYPAALSKAAGGIKALSSPNDTLAVEYIKALGAIAPWISPLAVKRKGAEHDSAAEDGPYLSASLIREKLRRGEDVSGFLPEEGPEELFFLERAERLMMYDIMTADLDRLMELPDMSEGLAKRLLSCREGCGTAAELTERLKNKSVTMARIRRTLLCLTLGVRGTDFFRVPYGRILGLNDRGREILSRALERTLSYDTSLAKLEKLSPEARRISCLERRAAALQQSCSAGEPRYLSEYTRKIALLR